MVSEATLFPAQVLTVGIAITLRAHEDPTHRRRSPKTLLSAGFGLGGFLSMKLTGLNSSGSTNTPAYVQT